jgi:CheY-like chemotaxis protein
MRQILVVDDDRTVLRVVTAMLQAAGFEVSAVSSGKEGLEQCQCHAFDLILSDITMPQMNGFEFIAFLRERDVETPVVFMSGDFVDQPPDMNTGGVIRKPFTLKELLSAVEAVQNGKPRKVKSAAHTGGPGQRFQD